MSYMMKPSSVLVLVFGLVFLAAPLQQALAQPPINRDKLREHLTPGQGQPEEEESSSNTMRKGAASAMRMDKGLEQSINKLPPGQMIDVNGKKMTAAQLRKMMEQDSRKMDAKMKAGVKEQGPDFSAIQAKFDKEQLAELDASNAKVRAEAERLKNAKAAPAADAGPRLDALKKEAAAIQARLKDGTATEADQKRAAELFNEFEQLN